MFRQKKEVAVGGGQDRALYSIVETMVAWDGSDRDTAEEALANFQAVRQDEPIVSTKFNVPELP